MVDFYWDGRINGNEVIMFGVYHMGILFSVASIDIMRHCLSSKRFIQVSLSHAEKILCRNSKAGPLSTLWNLVFLMLRRKEVFRSRVTHVFKQDTHINWRNTREENVFREKSRGSSNSLLQPPTRVWLLIKK